MAARKIASGQFVSPQKLNKAKQLRREMTLEERMLWERLRRNALGGLHFRRQQIISGFIVDFYCHAANLIVEIDGGIHSETKSYDGARDHVLRERGLTVLRIDAQAVVEHLDRALDQIATTARRLLAT